MPVIAATEARSLVKVGVGQRGQRQKSAFVVSISSGYMLMEASSRLAAPSSVKTP